MGSTTAVRVLVVDDFGPFRRVVSSIVRERAELQLIGEAADGVEAVRQVEKLAPHLVLLDIGLPGLNGIEAARQIRRLDPDCKILFVSQHSSGEMAREAMSLGACGYVIKSDCAGELPAALTAVLEGRTYLSSGLTDLTLADRIHAKR